MTTLLAPARRVLNKADVKELAAFAHAPVPNQDAQDELAVWFVTELTRLAMTTVAVARQRSSVKEPRLLVEDLAKALRRCRYPVDLSHATGGTRLIPPAVAALEALAAQPEIVGSGDLKGMIRGPNDTFIDPRIE